MKRIIAIMKFPIYAMTVLLLILSILIAKGILWIVRLKTSDFDNLPKFLQDKELNLSNDEVVDMRLQLYAMQAYRDALGRRCFRQGVGISDFEKYNRAH